MTEQEFIDYLNNELYSSGITRNRSFIATEETFNFHTHQTTEITLNVIQIVMASLFARGEDTATVEAKALIEAYKSLRAGKELNFNKDEN